MTVRLTFTFLSISLFQWVGSSHQVAKVLERRPKKKNVIYLKLYFIWQPCSWGLKVLGLSGSPVCVFRLVTSSLEPVGSSCFIIVLPHPSLFHCERIVCQFWNKESVDIKITNEYKSNILSPSFSSLRHGNAPVKLMQLLTWRTNSSLQELKPINCFFMYSWFAMLY